MAQRDRGVARRAARRGLARRLVLPAFPRARFVLLGAFALVLQAPTPACAEKEWLPSSKELFRPLEADPRELGYQARLTSRDEGDLVGEIGFGDYLGLIRVPFAGGVRSAAVRE